MHLTTDALEFLFWLPPAVSLLLIGHALWPRVPRERTPRRRLAAVLVAAGEAVGIGFWLGGGLVLFGWAFWYGDNDHWFWTGGWCIGAVVAGVTAAAVAWKLATGRASRRFLYVHAAGAIVLLASLGATYAFHFLNTIKGTNPDAIAQQFADNLSARTGEPIRVIETQRAPDDTRRSYRLMAPDEPRGRLSLHRRGWFGWSHSSSAMFPPSQDELARARQRLKTDTAGGKPILECITENYPGTPSAAEAQKLLDGLKVNSTRQ
ncbi:MAG: hypothetical protein DWQ37_17245 [Planctomycetota bacterium]|nr:MAG: hypothetical protein DWQ37_17245 [Planctomycetota bacterium]